MTKSRWLGAAAALSILSLVACDVATHQQQTRRAADGDAQPAAADKLARVEMNADTSFLTAEEREVVNLLIQAAELMNPIYLAPGDRPTTRACAPRSRPRTTPALLDRFDTFIRAVGRARRGQALLRRRAQAGRRRASTRPT